MSGPLGVAVVGLGVGEQHARAFHGDARCRIRCVYDLDTDRARAVTASLGAGEVAPSFEAILDRSDVQIVSIASYDDAHFDQVLRALDAGKHVFVEKPLCRTIDETRAIKARWAAHRGQLKLMCNLVLRAAPLYRWLRGRIQAGDMGRLYAFDGDYLYGRLWKITQGWRGAIEDYSVMHGGGIHMIDLLLWLSGERPTAVAAMGNRLCTEGSPFSRPDYVVAQMNLPSGLVGRISANFGCTHPHQHVIRVFGTQATFLYDDAGPRLQQSRDPSRCSQPVTLAALPATKGDLIPQFVDDVIADADLGRQTQAVFDAQAVSAACDEALRRGATVEVDYI